jgi:hypothetical protein
MPQGQTEKTFSFYFPEVHFINFISRQELSECRITTGKFKQIMIVIFYEFFTVKISQQLSLD